MKCYKLGRVEIFGSRDRGSFCEKVIFLICFGVLMVFNYFIGIFFLGLLWDCYYFIFRNILLKLI